MSQENLYEKGSCFAGSHRPGTLYITHKNYHHTDPFVELVISDHFGIDLYTNRMHYTHSLYSNLGSIGEKIVKSALVID